MKIKIKLENSFHGTETHVLAHATNGLVGISARQSKSAVSRLCGVAGCKCGGVRGGIWTLNYNQNGSATVAYCDGRPYVIA